MFNRKYFAIRGNAFADRKGYAMVNPLLLPDCSNAIAVNACLIANILLFVAMRLPIERAMLW